MTATKIAALVVLVTTSTALADPPRHLEESLQRKAPPRPPRCHFGPGSNTDIYGTGIDGGTFQHSLAACQAHCERDSTCQAAQFSAGGQRYNGYNCFIYNSQNNHYPVAAAISQFLLYKCSREQAPKCIGYWCGPYYKDIWGTGIDGGSYQWSWAACQDRCAQNGRCKAAQYSNDETWNGYNCFIYDNQNPNEPQVKNFKLYYYNGHNSHWSNGLNRDIDGVGLGGSWANTLGQCKDRCKATRTCKAAQWSATSQYKGYNCYIYDTDVTNRPQFMNFKLYKYRREGCMIEQWLCNRLYSDDAQHWTEAGSENSITNLALPVLLPIAAVVGVVGAIGVARRVRASQRSLLPAAEGEEMEVLE